MAKVTIFGGFGFVGSNLAEYLLSCGHEVTIFGHQNHNRYINIDLFKDRVRLVYGDFENPEDLAFALLDCEVVFHLICTTVPKTSNENPQYDIKSNLVPSLSLLEQCKKSSVKQVIFASSGGTVYGIPRYLPIDENHPVAPICAYGVQKLSIEHYMYLFHFLNGTNITILRISNAYGPRQNIKTGQGIIGTYCSLLANNKPLQVWGDGTVIRDFIFISDLVEAMESIIGKESGFHIYNLGSGERTSVNDLIKVLKEITDGNIVAQYLPGRPFDVPSNVLNIKKFQDSFLWKPRNSLKEGLKKTFEWFIECA